jgi:photosystem II stability/assembly factor-like uncharacterized protein
LGYLSDGGIYMKIRSIAFVFALILFPALSFAQWVQTSLTAGEINTLTASGTNLFSGTNGEGMFRTTDSGANWTAINSGITNDTILSCATNGADLFAGSQSGGVFRSEDNGGSWVAVNAGLTNLRVSALLSNNTTLFAGTWCSGVFRSSDSGQTWISTNMGLPDTVYVNAFAISGTSLYVACDGQGVFRSTDGGATWTSASSGLTNTSVTVLTTIGADLFAGTFGNGIFLSGDSGVNWISDTSSMINPDVFSFATVGANLFVGTFHDELFCSSDIGQNWSSESGTQFLNDYLDIFTALAVCGDDLFAATANSGVWHRPLSQMIGNSGVQTNVTTPTLEQNYPNPFTRQTTIPFSLTQTEHVTITIFNVLGQQVAALADQEYDAGAHDVMWDAGSAPSGTYVCRIAAPEGIRTLSLVHQTE